jgi:hypothetical protein
MGADMLSRRPRGEQGPELYREEARGDEGRGRTGNGGFCSAVSYEGKTAMRKNRHSSGQS